MVIQITVKGDHFWVRDGCIGSTRAKHPDWPEEKILRDSPANLLYGNISIGHGFYTAGEPVELECKVCREKYRIPAEDFIEVE
ncbi:MAG: hypothetical protein KKD18_03150, partial [Nanoarchaeota archaeon]|nr:hypothetical protein [Nanoarchaeota archaeon]